MRDPESRRASKRAYYERHKAQLQEKARERYAAQRAAGVPRKVWRRARRPANGRDQDRRRASRAAYYERNRATLQVRARERMTRLRAAQGLEGKVARQWAMRSYRLRYHDLLTSRRRNLYRKRWMLKNGVSQFLQNFRARIEAPHGELLEHWDYENLVSVVRGAGTHDA